MVKHNKLTAEQWNLIKNIPLTKTKEITKVWVADDGIHIEIVTDSNE